MTRCLIGSLLEELRACGAVKIREVTAQHVGLSDNGGGLLYSHDAILEEDVKLHVRVPRPLLCRGAVLLLEAQCIDVTHSTAVRTYGGELDLREEESESSFIIIIICVTLVTLCEERHSMGVGGLGSALLSAARPVRLCPPPYRFFS